jgi:AraC-like DNA-binding protein
MATSEPVYRDGDRVCYPDRHEHALQGIAAGGVRLLSLGHDPYLGRRLPRNVLPGIRMVGYWDAERPQQWGTDFHYNEGIEVVFLDAGQLAFSACNEQYTLHAGDATVTGPWLQHCLGDPCVGATRLYWFILDVGVRGPDQPWRWPSWVVLSAADRRKLADRINSVPVHVWQTDSLLRRCFQRIGQAVETDRGGSNQSLLAVLLNESLVLLLDAVCKPEAGHEVQHSTQQQVERFWKEMRASPEQLGEEWTLQKLAASCGLAETRFVHYTRQFTNLPPLHYLRLCRLELAAQWLVGRPEQSVTAIGLACGFPSPHHFAKVFQKHFGCTPSIYRVRTDARKSP